MFSYTVSKTADEKKFEEACRLIESKFKGIDKDAVLHDVDGSAIQIYHRGSNLIRVYDDYEVDCVYVDSEIELNDIF